MRRVFVAVPLMLYACGEPPSATTPAPAAMTKDDTITIREASEREAAVGKSVVVIGIQTRTKQPQVNGVDVDGAYELSDKKVVARGILEKNVVPEEPPRKDGLQVASRGAGTFYSVIDPTTKMLAKTKLAE
jgi:hypothetical protein